MTESVVTLRIAGDSRGAVAATQQAAQAVTKLGATATQTAAATSGAGTALDKLGRDARQAGGAVDALGGKMKGARFELGGLQAALAGAGLIGFAVVVARASDAAAGLDARLKIVSRSTEEYANAQGLVLRIAQETRQSLESTGALYIRLSSALKDTGASQAEVANLTRTINQAFAVSGASASEAAAAITQLSQGLAAGALRGDEFNSVAEQSPRIMDALAKSLGVSRGELRAMAENGELTAEVIRTALRDAAADIGAEFAQLPITIGGGLQQVQNSFSFLVGYLDKESGTGSAIGRFLGVFADFVESIPAVLVGVFGQFETWWANLKAVFQAAGLALKTAIMEPLNAIVRGLQLSLAQLAQAAAQLPAGLGDDLALSLGKAIGQLNQFTFTSAEAREELAAIAAARDAEVDAIQRNVAAQQEDFTARRAAIASEKEYENRIRTTNASRKEADTLSKNWAAAERQLAAQRRPLLDQFLEEVRARRELSAVLRDAERDLDMEIRLAGLSGDARRALTNEIEAENFALQANGILTDENVEKLRALYLAKLEQRDATEQAARAQEDENQALAQYADNYLSQATDAIGDFVSRGMNGWKDLWQSFKDIGKRALAEFISNIARQRIVVPILAQITGQGTAGAGGGGLGSLLGNVGGGLGGGIGGILGAAGSVAGLFGGLGGLGTGLTASAGIFGSAGLIGGLTGSISAGFASIAGGSILQGVGLLAGPIGLAVGALALLAGALKDTTRRITVIGSELVGTAGFRNLAPDAVRQSALGGFAFASIDNVSREERDQLAGAIQQFDAAIAGLLDADQLATVRAAVAAINTSAEEGAITAETFIQRRFDAVLGSMSQSVQDFVREGGTLEEQMERLGEALRRPAEIESVLGALERDEMLATMTELERQTLAVNEQFDAAIEYLTDREASEEQLARVEELRTLALGRLQAAQEDVMEVEEARTRDTAGLARLLGDLRFDESLVGLSELDRQLAILARQTQDAIDAATAMGATEDELAEIREIGAARARRLTAAQEAANSGTVSAGELANQAMAEAAERAREIADAFRSIVDFLRDESFSETSTLTPTQRFAEAQSQFQDLLTRAANGDQQAAAGIAGAAQRLLSEGLSFLGGGDQYRALREAVLAALGPLASFAQSGSGDVGSVQGRLLQALATFRSLFGGGAGVGPSPSPAPGVLGAAAANPGAFGGLAGSVGALGSSAANDPGSPYARLETRLAAVETAVRQAGDAQVSAINRLASSGARFA